MNDYPLPSAAVGLWLAGDTIYVRFPPSAGSDKAHIIHLEASEMGLKNLLVILRAREAARAGEDRLGHRGTPTQYDLEKVASALMRTEPRRRPPALAGLTLDDLELDI